MELIVVYASGRSNKYLPILYDLDKIGYKQKMSFLTATLFENLWGKIF